MRIYLAGHHSQPRFFPTNEKERNELKVYLAGIESRPWVLTQGQRQDNDLYLAGGNGKADSSNLSDGYMKPDDNMKMYIEGNYGDGKVHEMQKINPNIDISKLFILESYYYMNDVIQALIPKVKSYMLDSGAFTFMQNAKVKVDWEDYIQRYGEFVKDNHIDLFFELDIDSVVGYDKVKKYRKLLENISGKLPIPVWHQSRGKIEFLKSCEDYPYVALGGIVSKEWSKDEYRYFPYFINEAHKRGAKIHGLGFTNLEGLKKYHFDSVDSTSWTTGNRFGFIYKFTGTTMMKINAPNNHRLADSRISAFNNFAEWVKFQRYAERYL